MAAVAESYETSWPASIDGVGFDGTPTSVSFKTPNVQVDALVSSSAGLAADDAPRTNTLRPSLQALISSIHI